MLQRTVPHTADTIIIMRRRTFIQLALATAVSPRFLQTESDPISVLVAMGYQVEPYQMMAEEYNRVYRLPVGMHNFRCPRGHQRVFAGVPGARKLRCVICPGERREIDLEGGNGVVLACGKWWKLRKSSGMPLA